MIRGVLLLMLAGGSAAMPAAQSELVVERLRPGLASYTEASAIDESRQFVVRDPGSWRATWALLHGRSRTLPPLPPVDFERHMLVVAALGRQRTGGFTIRIEGAHRTASGLVIQLHEARPGRGCIVPSAITYPADVARLVMDHGPVTFQTEVVVHDCS